MTRPRESLLNMFDPLVDAETPSSASPRDSGELSSSDKENAPSSKATGSNPLTMTKFFDRAYARHKAVPATLPKGALIDFDISMMSDDSVDTGTEDEASANDDRENENSSVQHAAITPRRKVLGDIRVEQAQSPMGLLDATPLRMQSLSAPPFGASSANRDKYRSNAASEPSSPEPPATPPSISILPPDAVTSSPLVQQSPTSPAANRRMSLDLHASFNMSGHLRDTSFDLLNDRISFVGCDSMLSNESMDVDMFSAPVNETLGLGLAGEESDHGGFADESDTASEVDFGGSLSERLADVHLYIDSESDNENKPSRKTSAALATPRPPAVGTASKSPHSVKHSMRAVHTHSALPLSDENSPPQVERRGSAQMQPRGSPALAPAAPASTATVSNDTTTVPTQPVAPLRIAKKPQLARRVSLVPAPRAAPPASLTASRPGTSSGQQTRVPSPAALPARAQPTVTRPRTFVAPSQAAASTIKATVPPVKARSSIAPASTTGVLRPTQASLMKGATAARVPAGRPSGVPATGPSKLQRAPSVTAGARVPVRPAAPVAQPAKTASSIRPPSRFSAPTAASAARKPIAPTVAAATAPARDVAKILRGPASKRT